jgi:thiamine-phosphate pyrophosphorylase
MTPAFDPRFYAIVDLEGPEPAVPFELIEQALAGGVTLLQLRAKAAGGRVLHLLARQVGKLARRHGVPLILNDRADVAMAAGVQGVHLGRSDVPAGPIRRIWPEGLIGVSVHSLAELGVADGIGVDYVASGCLYPSVSKRDAVPLSGALFAEICRASVVPVIGIGGITVERVPEVLGLGAGGVAVINGLWSAPDVARRSAEYRGAVEGKA